MPRLSTLAKSFQGVSDDKLEAEVLRLREERRTLARELNQTPLRDDAHRGIDKAAEEAEQRLQAVIAAHVTDLVRLPLEGATVSLDEFARQERRFAPSIVERLHAAVEAAPAGVFSDGSRADFEARLAELDGEIEQRREELERRGIAARKRDAEAELARLEERVSA